MPPFSAPPLFLLWGIPPLKIGARGVMSYGMSPTVHTQLAEDSTGLSMAVIEVWSSFRAFGWETHSHGHEDNNIVVVVPVW